MDKMRMESPDLLQIRLEKLAELFPEAITETRGQDGGLKKTVNFDLLREILTGEEAVGDEAYEFTWVGKREARREAARPIRKTLRPCPEESKNWDSTENLYIEGDNLDVLKLLQESYLGRVKMIYIDPPYNTAKDFIYNDKLTQSRKEYAEASGHTDENGNNLVQNTENNARFHSDWCSMIYPRLLLARSLLSEDGVIFISIDDNEVAQLRKICDEVFGEKNFIGSILWKKKTNGNNMGLIPPVHDYILSYAKSIVNIDELGYDVTEEFISKTYSNPDSDPRGPWTTMDLSANHKGPYFGIENVETGEIFFPPNGRYWVFNEQEVQKRIQDGRIIFGKLGKSRPVQKVFASERLESKIRAESWWDKHGMNEDATDECKELLQQSKLFTHPNPS
ncbi:MAG: site-specific DNA-methyltransferase [Desulfovibrionaceae bacterium]|nr:site-specific DNA-methyltransferase [Desulfovibrionaceae bacterium]